MPRAHQASENREKFGYTRSATTDEPAFTNPSRPPRPIARVKHPADRSSILLAIKRISRFALALFLSLPCVILVTLILPFVWLLRTVLRLTCRYHCTVAPCTCSYLAASDLFWLYNSNLTRNENKSDEPIQFDSQAIAPTAAAIFFLEGTVNESSLKKILLNRLITNNARRGSNVGRKLFPRFSQVIVSHFTGVMWIDYSAFSIDEHVREIPCHIQSDEDLQSYVSTLLSTALTSTRPLWQLHYKNRSSSRPNDSVLVFLYHPVLSDGVSLIRILLKHIVDNRTTQLDLKPRFAGGHGEHVFDYIKAYLFGHTLLLSKVIFNSQRDNFLKRVLRRRAPTATSSSSPSAQRAVVWSTPFSLTKTNRMKLVTRTRMNDLLSAVVISSLKLYMERYGTTGRDPIYRQCYLRSTTDSENAIELSVSGSSFNSSNLNCVIPCDLRSNTPNIVMGNHIAHLSLDLPMNIEGNIPLLWSFNDSTKRVKQNGDYATMYLYTSMVYLLFPMCIANKIMARIYDNSAVWLTTIAAGSSTALSTMSICNRDVRSFVCLNPSMGTSCINFCVTCYADEVRLSVVADPQLVPHPEFFTECFNQQLSVVQELLGHRRIPGEVRRITRPPRSQAPKKSISSISDMSDDLSIEEIQAKMTALQQELLSLKSQFENVDMNDPSSQTQRLIITTKLEELRREFRELLIKLQERQCELSGMIPSDEEDEMDPHVRVRLRSASVASKISLRSNEQRQLSTRMYTFDRDDGSEISGSVTQAAGLTLVSSSKMSFVPGQVNQQQAGMRRAQSVGICENTRIDMQRRPSLSRTRPTTPARTFAVLPSTVVYVNSSERGS